MKSEDYKKHYIVLIKKYGEDNELETFDLCSNWGVSLDGSTIDKIVYNESTNEVFFVFNENEPYNSAELETFAVSELSEFYYGLSSHLSSDIFKEVKDGHLTMAEIDYLFSKNGFVTKWNDDRANGYVAFSLPSLSRAELNKVVDDLNKIWEEDMDNGNYEGSGWYVGAVGENYADVD